MECAQTPVGGYLPIYLWKKSWRASSLYHHSTPTAVPCIWWGLCVQHNKPTHALLLPPLHGIVDKTCQLHLDRQGLWEESQTYWWFCCCVPLDCMSHIVKLVLTLCVFNCCIICYQFPALWRTKEEAKYPARFKDWDQHIKLWYFPTDCREICLPWLNLTTLKSSQHSKSKKTQPNE